MYLTLLKTIHQPIISPLSYDDYDEFFEHFQTVVEGYVQTIERVDTQIGKHFREVILNKSGQGEIDQYM